MRDVRSRLGTSIGEAGVSRRQGFYVARMEAMRIQRVATVVDIVSRTAATRVCGIVLLGLAIGGGAGVAAAVELRIEPSVLGQVRDGYWSGETEAPMELYGDLGVSRLPHGTTLDTYFRLEEDFARLDGETDFFVGALRTPSAPWGLDVGLGRQIIAESPLGLWAADSGQVRVGLGEGPFSVAVFGGQPQYWEPTFGPPNISQDEQIFGGNFRWSRFGGGALAVGYLQLNRQGDELMQEVTLSGTRTFTGLPGLPSLYGNFAFDADHANVDRVRAGFQSFVWKPNLLANFEAGYYKPQDRGDRLVTNPERREDPIFQLFSVSDLLQFRGGLRYSFTTEVSTYVDLSYQRYEQLQSSFVDGYVWSTGALYKPGGDGLEIVELEYYGIDSGGGSVNGGRFTYENRVYEDILFRALCDVAGYDKATNQDGIAIASLIGVGYMILPGLVAEVNVEANRNQLFPEDYRFGFFVSYSAGYTTDGGLERNVVGNQGRPWPWAPAAFGPASWGSNPAVWTGNPGMPAGGWATPAFAAADATRAAQRARDAAAPAAGGAGADPGSPPPGPGTVAAGEIVGTVASRGGSL